VCAVAPVKIALRFGEHCGEVTKQFVNRIPSRAIRSKFGVVTTGFP
jgi:hypothetical protein